ncbi:MAG: hypothetical protein WDO56_13140 [Gammaproteobacteria bacterium]
MLAVSAMVGAVAGTPAFAAEQPPLPAGARVGIIVMVSTDVTHYHVGKNPSASFMRTYRVSWPASEVIDDPLAGQLKTAGFEPVFLDPSDLLRRQQRQWIVATPQAVKLSNAAMEEIQRIATAESLKALIIVTPGPNVNPEAIQGNRLRKMPAYVQGWGFSTSDDATKPVVFNLTQMLLVVNTGNSAELEFREWGAGYVYEWSNFDPGADLKALPQSEIDKFRPVISDVLQRQIGRLMPHLKPAG